MPKKERPLQMDMFSEKLVDNRTRRQKKRDKEREAPQQSLMFSQREIAQFGVNSRPQFELPPAAVLRFLDPNLRTPAEIEAEHNKDTSEFEQKSLLGNEED